MDWETENNPKTASERRDILAIRGPWRAVWIAGFSMFALGFLTSGARADALDDALKCLDQQGRLIDARDRQLQAADSIGRRIEESRAGGRRPDGQLRDAERIQRKALDLELDLMAQREHCRALARDGLAACERRITELEAAIGAGRGSSASAASLIRLRESRSRLDAALAGPAVLEYPPLPPDSSDTQETLRAKLQYHQDVGGYLQALGLRVKERLARISEERRTLVEAQRFLQDLNFVDEGGRASPGGPVRIRGGIPGGGDPGGGAGRPAGSAEIARAAEDLEFALGVTPTTPEESDRLIRLLDGFRREIQRELDSVSKETRNIEQRILPETPASR